MRIIIDTHVLIWYLNGDKDLPGNVIQAIENPDNKVVISVVSLWELTIKISLKKIEIGVTLDQIQDYIKGKDVELMDITFDSLIALSKLPHHHGDPFDRMLIAQAVATDLPLISADRYFKSYPINVIW